MTRKKKFKLPALIEYSNEPVVTTEVLAKYFECDINNLNQNFKRNAERFIENKDFFKVSGDALKQFKDFVTESHLVQIQISPHTPILHLWTRWGAFRHAKILNNDRAWEIYEQLVEFYFDHEKFEWNKARADGKVVRKNFTDVMEKFYEYAKAQGTSRPKVAFFSYYSKLCNKAAGLPNTDGRDNARLLQFGICAVIENSFSDIIIDGMEKNLPYREIEQNIKTWIEKFKEIVYPKTFLTA